MSTPLLWALGLVVAAGLVLSSLHLVGRPVRGAAVALGWLHGVAGVGAAIATFVFLPRGIAAWMLLAASLGGAMVAVARLRGRRPDGLTITLHAVFGLAGFILLVAAFG